MALADDPELGGPEQAFEDLRAEVGAMRQIVESLPASWEETQPPDYSVDLGRIAKGLAVVADQLEDINQHPTLRLTPEQHGQAVARAGHGLMRETAYKLDQATKDMTREREKLTELIGTARRRADQRGWLITVGFGGMMAGIVVWTLLVEILPFGMGTWLAAIPIAGNKWDAGLELLQEASPNSLKKMTTLYNACANQTVEFCQEAIVAKVVSYAAPTGGMSKK